MSYRTIKRLLGETSLERKCRLLFGIATFFLIIGSFVWYAWKTEGLAYEQANLTGRTMAAHALAEAHARHSLPNLEKQVTEDVVNTTLGKQYKARYEIIREKTKDAELKAAFTRFLTSQEDQEEFADTREGIFHYYFAFRATDSCIRCHRADSALTKDFPELPLANQEGDLLGVAYIRTSAEVLENRIHINRAILITSAMVSSLLLMIGSWVIVRYVIVKPVQHLKDVSDSITSGNLNIRSEILTGDEFEDLSHAFNRMLKSLAENGEELRKMNAELTGTNDSLAKANMALNNANRHKSDFLATMSHELRTPLSSIIGFSEVLGGSGSFSEKQKKWIDNIHTSGKHLLNVVNDVLEVAKLESGKLQVKPEIIHLKDQIESVVGIFRQQAETKKITLESHLPDDLPSAFQDPQKVQQILWNLIHNAIKFTPEGGRIDVTILQSEEKFQIMVRDNGIGIPFEEQEAVFEKFRQVGRTLTREQGGSGLGLSIVKELTVLLGGEIALQSTINQGSLFTVTLPILYTAPELKIAG